MELARGFLGKVVTLTLHRVDMKKHRGIYHFRTLKSLAKLSYIVSVNGSHITEAEVLKKGAFIY